MPAPGGQRLCAYHPTSGVPRGLVLYVHPFAEEMNKARRMAALQARALAAAGYAVLQIDLLGCGDSSGDFGDASWRDWVDDVQRAIEWLRAQASGPLWLWGLRAGCLVAVQAARQLKLSCNFLFWQPSSAGKLVLQQFLRLKVASTMLDGGAKGAMEALRQDLATGRAVEVAGYTLATGLAQGLDAASLLPPPSPASSAAPSGRRLEWLELSTRPDATLSPASTQVLDAWRLAGFAVRSRVVSGPGFWQTAEIEDAPALIESSILALGS